MRTRQTLRERTNDPFSRGWMTMLGLLIAGLAFGDGQTIIGLAALAAIIRINA